MKVYRNQHEDLFRFLFTEDSLKIERGLELVARSHFSYNFLMKCFLAKYYINWPNFVSRLCLLLKFFSKTGFVSLA